MLFFNFSSVYSFLVRKSVVNSCIYGPCVSWCCKVEDRRVFFFLLKSSNCFPVKNHVFESYFIFCIFVCKDGALKLCLQVFFLPASRTKVRPAKLHKNWKSTDWICEFEFLDGYKSSNDCFRFTFYYFGAKLHSLFWTFLFAVANFIWDNEASRCCEFNDGENGRFFPIYQR